MKNSWPTKKLGEVAEFQKGKLMPNSAVRTEGVTPYILIDDLRSSSYSHFTPSNQGTACMPSDTLLVWDGANAGTIGGGLIGFVGSTITKVSPAEEVDPEFLRIFLSSKFSEFNKQVHGAAIPHLNKNFVCNLPIPLPPLAIQKQIVERLDEIAEAQKLNDELIQKSDELFQSLLHQEISQANKNWPLKDIGSMVDFSQLGLVRSKDKQNDNFGFNYIKMDSISLSGDLLLNKLVRVNATSHEVKKFRLIEGDFIFNTRNTPELVGKSTIFNLRNSDIYLFNNNILRMRFKNGLLAGFLNYYLHTKNGIKKLNSKKRGTTSVSAIYQGDLFSIKIPTPSLDEQKQIVEKLSAAQEYKKKLLTQKSKLRELFNSVLHKSMKGEII